MTQKFRNMGRARREQGEVYQHIIDININIGIGIGIGIGIVCAAQEIDHSSNQIWIVFSQVNDIAFGFLRPYVLARWESQAKQSPGSP